jgi:hypothetical protein
MPRGLQKDARVRVVRGPLQAKHGVVLEKAEGRNWKVLLEDNSIQLCPTRSLEVISRPPAKTNESGNAEDFSTESEKDSGDEAHGQAGNPNPPGFVIVFLFSIFCYFS